jgi:multicomponent Na+:H+ antiporter subunit D
MALFQVGIHDNHPMLIALIFLGGALSFVYMFQIYRRRTAEIEAQETSPWGVQFVVVLLALVVLGMGVWPDPLLNLVERAAQSLPEGQVP